MCPSYRKGFFSAEKIHALEQGVPCESLMQVNFPSQIKALMSGLSLECAQKISYEIGENQLEVLLASGQCTDALVSSIAGLQH